MGAKKTVGGYHIYGENMWHLAVLVTIVEALIGALWRATDSRPRLRTAFRVACALAAVVALYGIACYTVLGRVPTGEHRFAIAVYTPGETMREMFMNALLYVPLGLALAPLAGPWAVLAGLALSVGIEAWQYVAGTGLAQATDVVCNVLGCAVGLLPYADWPAIAIRLRR